MVSLIVGGGPASPFHGTALLTEPGTGDPALTLVTDAPAAAPTGDIVLRMQGSDGVVICDLDDAGNFFGSSIQAYPLPGSPAFLGQVGAATHAEFVARAGGVIDLGPGTAAADAGLKRVSPSVVAPTDGAAGLGAIANLVKAGIPSDSDFPSTPPDGTVVGDKTNNRLYIRLNGAWKYAALT